MSESTKALAEIPPDECWELLRTHTLGVLAFVNDEGQQLLPVNFTEIDGFLYFRTNPDTVVADLAEGHRDVAFAVLFQADSFPTGWNVTVRGSTERVTDSHVESTVLHHPRLDPWVGGERDLVIALSVSTISGRRIHRS